MANNTQSGFEPGAENQAGLEASTVGGYFHADGSAPFGNPDQRLYGGPWSEPPASAPAAAPGGLGYQGRHRAAD
jgi:hypothetical protein